MMTTRTSRPVRLGMDARYLRERRDLYRTKAHGAHAASPGRLRDMERSYDIAAERLRAAEAEPSAADHSSRADRDELPIAVYDRQSPDFVEASLRRLIGPA